MASVERYTTKKGTRYVVRWRDEDHKSRERGRFRTKREAELAAAEVELSLANNTYVSPSQAKVTIRELGELWLASKASVVKPSTFHSLESAWRIHVEPRWGSRQVAQISHTAVQAWVSELGESLSATTTKRAFGVLSGILAGAVKDRRIAANPCDGVQTKPKIAKERVYLDDQQLAALAREAGVHRTMVLVMGYCGLRWGETIALRVKDVNLKSRRINVAQNAVQVNGDIHVGTPKTHAVRSVAFPAFLVAALQEQCRDKLPNALVFPGREGTYMRRPGTSLQNKSWWVGAVHRSGVPHLTLHDLRHTAASLAISAGANVKAVQRMLGHKSAAMTLDVYSGLFESDLDDVAAALDRRGAIFNAQPS